MSKIATYLNEHLSGEVLTSGAVLDGVSTDGGVLLERPEMVAEVANTSDIRKVARFCWQLAEKGHTLPVVVRGGGEGRTGAAISSGVIVSPNRYMNRVIGIDAKQRLIHVQAGASCSAVNTTLSTHRGMTLPLSSYAGSEGTIGGAIASGAVGFLARRYGSVGSAVKQLEVVLASGEVLQTGRISKRELNTKKGLQTLEGEIYRQVDNIITDNTDLLKTLANDSQYDTGGFRNIVRVKQKDGSFDLTPLFVGSQGNLGIISEAIMQTQFARHEFSVCMAAYKTVAEAREAADIALAQKASSVEIVDGRVLARVAMQGKKRDFAPSECFKGALVVALYDDFGAKTRERLVKKLSRDLKKTEGVITVTEKGYTLADMTELFAIRTIASEPRASGEVVPGVFSGLWLPMVQVDVFLKELVKIEAEYGIALPFWIDAATGYIDLLPVFDMKKVSDRQKLIKILAEVANLVDVSGGALSARGGDGRLKSAIGRKSMGEDEVALYDQIKQAFDPHGILNPGVKQEVPTKDLVSQLNAWSREVV